MGKKMGIVPEVTITSGRAARTASRVAARKVPIDSHGSISAHSARTKVVLPSPCPPETTIDRRALTAAARKLAITGVTVCQSTRSANVTRRTRWRRINTDGRAVSGQAAYVSRGSQLFQVVLYAGVIDAEVAETYFSSLKFEPGS